MNGMRVAQVAKEIKPPEQLSLRTAFPEVFLGGSIDQGKASDWQQEVVAACADLEVLFLNPRRDHWDSSWKQDSRDPNLNFQVHWEQDGLERVDLAIFYFEPGTLAPISIGELGQLCKSGKVLVCCPEGYWRKGNIDILCQRNNIPMAQDLRELIQMTREWVTNFLQRADDDRADGGSL